MTGTLFEQVRRKLNITWEDDDTTARINDIINTAIPDLIHKLGITDPDFDFATAGAENKLFLAYCLYEWNHAANEFDENYHNDIAQVQARHAVKHFKESEESESEQTEIQ